MSVQQHEGLLEDLYEHHYDLLVHSEGWPQNTWETINEARTRARNELTERN